MKRNFLVFLCLLAPFFAISSLTAAGIVFFQGSWEQALTEAQQNKKLIFVDAYTSWCGPCQMMSKTVFTDSKVGIFYNQHFINVKLDMEKGEGVAFAKKYRVNAYPTLLYIDGSGKIVHSGKGGRQADAFIELGKEALNKNDRSDAYATKYDAGDRSPELLKDYAYALLEAGKPHLKIANEFIATQKDLATDANIAILYDFSTEADSKIFDLMIQNKAAVIKKYSQEGFEAKLDRVANVTVEKAITFKSEDLLKTAQSVSKHFIINNAGVFMSKIALKYYADTKDAGNFKKNAAKFVKKYAKANDIELNNLAKVTHATFSNDQTLVNMAIKWTETAIQTNNQPEYYLTKAQLLEASGDRAAALATAQKGAEDAKKQQKDPVPLLLFIRSLEPAK